jgi:dihydroxyacetone kinase-like predicted kinase
MIELKAAADDEGHDRPLFKEEEIVFGYCTEFFIKGRNSAGKVQRRSIAMETHFLLLGMRIF